MLTSYFLLSLLAAAFSSAFAAPSLMGMQRLTSGSSIAVDKENQFLISPNGTFSSGFYRVGNNSYCFSIWFTNSFHKTVVWMANRDKPVNGEQSRLTLNFDSNLILTDADDTVVWSTDTTSVGEIELRLLETGNLVVMNQSQHFIWQSFDFPTDTLLPTQRFLKTSTLISMRSLGTYLSGFYYFKFNDDNILNLIFNGPSLSSIYWPYTLVLSFVNGRNPYNSSRIAILDETGSFESSDGFQFNATDDGVGPKRRLTMDYDGVLRLYSLDESTGNWKITWLPGGRIDACMVHGLCGDYGICEYNPLPTCTCPPGFSRNDPSDWTKGCKPPFNFTCDSSYNSSSSKEFDFLPLPNTDYFGYDWGYAAGVPIEICKNICLTNCKCAGFGYAMDGSAQCYPKTALRNGYRKPDTAVQMFMKVPKSLRRSWLELKSSSELNCSDSELVLNTHVYGEKGEKFRYIVTIGASELIFIGFGWWFIFRKRVNEELLISGKNASNFRWFGIEEEGECTDLVKWIMKSIEKGEVKKVVDPRLKVENEEQNKKMEMLLKVAVECVREDRNSRPAMSQIVELLTCYEQSNLHEDIVRD
uniref:non-specific serine/threonine protein kinase n=1 Tax=Cucumis sativus TaxID=3659 RepID=A0A0A0LAF2_CUCSA